MKAGRRQGAANGSRGRCRSPRQGHSWWALEIVGHIPAQLARTEGARSSQDTTRASSGDGNPQEATDAVPADTGRHRHRAGPQRSTTRTMSVAAICHDRGPQFSGLPASKVHPRAAGVRPQRRLQRRQRAVRALGVRVAAASAGSRQRHYARRYATAARSLNDARSLALDAAHGDSPRTDGHAASARLIEALGIAKGNERHSQCQHDGNGEDRLLRAGRKEWRGRRADHRGVMPAKDRLQRQASPRDRSGAALRLTLTDGPWSSNRAASPPLWALDLAQPAVSSPAFWPTVLQKEA